jgi:bacterioferritin
VNNPFSCQSKVDLPYPSVQAGEVNPIYARAMLSNMGGSISEMTAVSLYFYNSLVIRGQYKQFASCFNFISIVEMHHLDIFGELALQLGADPRLWNKRNFRYVYWTPAYNQYPREIKALIRKYSKQVKSIQNPNIVENLKRIILDEQLHIKIFENMYEQVSRNAENR